MKKFLPLVIFLTAIIAFYVGVSIEREHPMDRLYESVIEKINDAHVVSFKSGLVVTQFDQDGEVIDEWQTKYEGTYDAQSEYLFFQNVSNFHNGNRGQSVDDVDETTSLSHEKSVNASKLFNTEQAYFKNGTYIKKDREKDTWSMEKRNSFSKLELLNLNSNILNRYAKHYKSENRGKFVVFFLSIDPNYLSRTFPNILEPYGYDFEMQFKEGTIKMLVYPDTLLPRRVYSIYRIKNLETGEEFEFNFDTYFSENEYYSEDEEPSIPLPLLQKVS